MTLRGHVSQDNIAGKVVVIAGAIRYRPYAFYPRGGFAISRTSDVDIIEILLRPTRRSCDISLDARKTMTVSDPLRRKVIAAIASLPLVASGAGQEVSSSRSTNPSGAKAVVAYFSRSGNTRVVAGLIQRSQKADIFEIKPVQPYPDDYLETVAQARDETADGFKPKLQQAPDIGGYEIVFLGFPIWGETAPPVIRSFLSAHDFAGKTVVPFVTHGGYGLGDSLQVLADHAPAASVVEGFVMEAEQERRTMETVNKWLLGLTV